jgi:hypothetical protein
MGVGLAACWKVKPNSGQGPENKEKVVLIIDNNDTRRIRDEGNHLTRLVWVNL